MDIRLDSSTDIERAAKEQIPKPLTDFQKRVLALHKDAMTMILSQSRKALTSDELTDAKDIKPHFEMGDIMLGVWFFSIDCKINGQFYKGALFANELAMVIAPTQSAATYLAMQGIESTIHELHHEMLTRDFRDAENEGLTLDIGGRKHKIEQPVNLQKSVLDTLDSRFNKKKH